MASAIAHRVMAALNCNAPGCRYHRCVLYRCRCMGSPLRHHAPSADTRSASFGSHSDGQGGGVKPFTATTQGMGRPVDSTRFVVADMAQTYFGGGEVALAMVIKHVVVCCTTQHTARDIHCPTAHSTKELGRHVHHHLHHQLWWWVPPRFAGSLVVVVHPPVLVMRRRPVSPHTGCCGG